jgi:Ser/Thr protein kinase RdoA (MazF antagonist)
MNQGWRVTDPAGQLEPSPGAAPRHVTDLTRQRLVRHGLAAAVALAERLGLPDDDHVVLSNRGNLLVHFPVAGVVARVATLTAWTRRDPLRWLAREVAVARHVAASGGPVVPPARGTDPGPHWQDGFAISLSDFIARTSPAPVPTPADCGIALAGFHAAASDCSADLGYLAPATDQVTDALAVIERESLADVETVAALRGVHQRLLGDIEKAAATTVVLHGDAHAGNLLPTGPAGGGWIWTDLEDTSRGPVSWDLATMTRGYDEAGTREALAAYAARAGIAAPAAESLEPFWDARDLAAAVWLACMARLYPERYSALAAQRLATVLSRR